MRLQPVKFNIARHSRVFSRRQFLIWPRILIIMLNSLKLEFYVCYFGQLMHFFYQLKDFSWIMRLDAIQDQLCEIAPSHNIRSLDYCSCTEFVKVHLEVEFN